MQVRASDGLDWSAWQSLTVTGPAATLMHTDGTTELMQVGNNFYLDSTATGIGPELTQGGVAVTPGTFTAIGAVQVSGGDYDVAWKMVGADTCTI